MDAFAYCTLASPDRSWRGQIGTRPRSRRGGVERARILESIWASEDPSECMCTFTPAKIWRFMIASDGHPVQHINLVTGKKVFLDVLEATNVEDDETLPEFVSDVRKPLCQRQIVLKDETDNVLLYAASWWDRSRYEEIMGGENNVVVWEKILTSKLEIARRIEKFHFGYNDELEDIFGRRGPFWGREYCFKIGKVPMARFYEVFSPTLEKQLGEMTVPSDLGGDPVATWLASKSRDVL
ncbi:hypothetical protein NDN08_001888 [Rhodosorus marinus]|uniref:Uncharacterized protein n=1 Tax=Rhodosorus marinus TaxID=101924 RepID=A0AAV8UXX4_9RHOD|nr:hypothetical protein NDN08_001888 [Rhodosorus marinus]